MAVRPDGLLRYVAELAVPSRQEDASDAVLVSRFIAVNDGRAFSALVNRYGTLVLRVCHRILCDSEDAEDAFQATFIVLARKAQTLRSRESLAGWLYGVARRVSLKARALRAKKLRQVTAAPHPPAPRPDPLDEISARELIEILDEELESLPLKQRLSVLLCCLEGLSLEEAARRLGWKPGAVKGHLQRGRHRLQARLVSRGLSLSAALAAVEASRCSATSAFVAKLASEIDGCSLVRATSQGTSTTGVSMNAVTLARAVLRSMASNRLLVAAGFLLATCLVAVGLFVRGVQQPPATEHLPTDSEPLQVAAARVDDNRVEAADDDDIPVEVNGRVLDPTGRPFTGASLYVGYTASDGRSGQSSPQNDLPLRAKSGKDGGFHFTVTMSELDARMRDESRPAVIAVAKGYGPEWSQIIRQRQPEMLTLKLVEDLAISGRVLDAKGKPVAGAKVRVLNIDSDSEENVKRSVTGLHTDENHIRRWRGAFPERPQEVTADAEGRFSLSGLGRDRMAGLVLDEQFSARGTIDVITRHLDSGRPSHYRSATFDLATPETRLVRGICRDHATGRPAAGVKISVWFSSAKPLRTDANGRFELPVSIHDQGSICVVAEPEAGQPYLVASALVPKATGSETTTLDIDLVRGIRVAGKIHAPPGGKLPSTGRVEYYPLSNNGHAAKIQTWLYLPASSALIQPDGSFQLVALPGPGAVAVAASPKRSFAAASVDDRELAGFFRDRERHRNESGLFTLVGTRYGILSPKSYNAVALINPDDKVQSLPLDVGLQPGIRLQGQLMDLDGQLLSSGTRIIGLANGDLSERIDGSFFEITELRPKEVREVWFIHKAKKLAKIITVHADHSGPLQVRLEPCGVLTGRVVDKSGRPIRETFIQWNTRLNSRDYEVFGASTDQNGRFELLAVPGVKYRCLTRLFFAGTAKNVQEFSLDPGQTQELGDLSTDAKGGLLAK
jgi:RNA polymerase sigma factor (sigma-70 family)